MCSRLGYSRPGNLFYPTFRLGLIRLLSEEVIFPTERVYAVRQGTDSVQESVWGIRPEQLHATGARANTTQLIINSRRESLKGFWAEQLRAFRCVLLATHYFEYRTVNVAGSTKQPYKFSLGESPIFAIAGLFAAGEQEQMLTTLVTVPASEQVSAYHDRMPAILTPERAARWLEPEVSQADLLSLLEPWREELTITEADRAALAVKRGAANAKPKGGSQQDSLFGE